MVNKLVASFAWNMVLCLIVGCGSKSGRDKGLYFARVPSVVTNQGEEAQERVSMGEWLLRLTVNILAFYG